MEDYPTRLRRVQRITDQLPEGWLAEQTGLEPAVLRAVLAGSHMSDSALRRIESLLIRLATGQVSDPADATGDAPLNSS